MTSTPYSKPGRPVTQGEEQPPFTGVHWDTGTPAPALKNLLKHKRTARTHNYGVLTDAIRKLFRDDTGQEMNRGRDQVHTFWFPDVDNLKTLPEATAHELIDLIEANSSIDLIEQAIREHRAFNTAAKKANKDLKRAADAALSGTDDKQDATPSGEATHDPTNPDDASATTGDPSPHLRLISSTDQPIAPPTPMDPVTTVTEDHLRQALASVGDKPATPNKRGPKPARTYSVLAIVVGFWLATRYGPHVTRKVMAECLAFRLPPSARERLGLPEFDWHDAETDPFANSEKNRRSYLNQHYRQVCRYFQQLREALNPSLVDVGHHMDKSALETVLATRTEEHLVNEMRRRARLQTIGDDILAACQPSDEQLIAWGADVAVDETALQSAAAFCKQASSHTTSDAFFSNSYKTPQTVMGWGLTAAILAPGKKGQKMPIIARSFRVHKSQGVNMDALQAVVDQHLSSHPSTCDGKSSRRPDLYVDAGYGGSNAQDHLAVQALGVSMQWDLLDYQYKAPRRIAVATDDDQPLGLVFGLGAFFTDAFTDEQMKIFDRFRPLSIDADEATIAQWDADRIFLEQRLMRIHAIQTVGDDDGVIRVRVRMSAPCRAFPANGMQATVACDRLPASLDDNLKRMLPLPTLHPKPLPEAQHPKICTQQTVSIYLDEHPNIQRAFLSGEVAGFAAREDCLDTARAYSEGLFGAAKNKYAGALAKHHTMRGEVEFTLMCAIGLAVHNQRALTRAPSGAKDDGDNPGFIPKIRSMAQRLRERVADLAG